MAQFENGGSVFKLGNRGSAGFWVGKLSAQSEHEELQISHPLNWPLKSFDLVIETSR